jgi:hypothetical protein
MRPAASSHCSNICGLLRAATTRFANVNSSGIQFTLLSSSHCATRGTRPKVRVVYGETDSPKHFLFRARSPGSTRPRDSAARHLVLGFPPTHPSAQQHQSHAKKTAVAGQVSGRRRNYQLGLEPALHFAHARAGGRGEGGSCCTTADWSPWWRGDSRHLPIHSETGAVNSKARKSQT